MQERFFMPSCSLVSWLVYAAMPNGVVLKRKRMQMEANKSQQKWKKSNGGERKQAEVR